mmetsp:Transcript_34004/g.85957  ORF Transcript_34004/g.85957 Transcript_34004/m.85957 type:complete len:96 (-) Transcript_34004:1952-2239(-)
MSLKADGGTQHDCTVAGRCLSPREWRPAPLSQAPKKTAPAARSTSRTSADNCLTAAPKLAPTLKAADPTAAAALYEKPAMAVAVALIMRPKGAST